MVEFDKYGRLKLSENSAVKDGDCVEIQSCYSVDTVYLTKEDLVNMIKLID